MYKIHFECNFFPICVIKFCFLGLLDDAILFKIPFEIYKTLQKLQKRDDFLKIKSIILKNRTFFSSNFNDKYTNMRNNLKKFHAG